MCAILAKYSVTAKNHAFQYSAPAEYFSENLENFPRLQPPLPNFSVDFSNDIVQSSPVAHDYGQSSYPTRYVYDNNNNNILTDNSNTHHYKNRRGPKSSYMSKIEKQNTSQKAEIKKISGLLKCANKKNAILEAENRVLREQLLFFQASATLPRLPAVNQPQQQPPQTFVPPVDQSQIAAQNFLNSLPAPAALDTTLYNPAYQNNFHQNNSNMF